MVDRCFKHANWLPSANGRRHEANSQRRLASAPKYSASGAFDSDGSKHDTSTLYVYTKFISTPVDARIIAWQHLQPEMRS